MPRHASNARAEYEIQTNTVMVGIFVSINVLNSLKRTMNPFSFSLNHFLYWFSAICPKTKKILKVKSSNFIAISTQIRSNYPSVRLVLPEETILPAKMY